MDSTIARDLQTSLRVASRDLTQWKLYNASKWCSELLHGMEQQDSEITDLNSTPGSPLNFKLSPMDASKHPVNRLVDPWMGLTAAEYDAYLFASSLFDMKEFDRCYHLLKGCMDSRLKFLQLYAQYLSFDKRYMEATEKVLMNGILDEASANELKMRDDQSGKEKDISTLQNTLVRKPPQGVITSESGHQTSLSIILNEIRDFLKQLDKRKQQAQELNKQESSDTFFYHQLGIGLLYYLKGIILLRQGNKSSAMASFLESLSYYSFNWSCWTELLNCITKVEDASILLKYLDTEFILKRQFTTTQSNVCDNVMIKMFKLLILQEYYTNSNSINPMSQIDKFFDIFESLLILVPNSSFLKSMNALLSYNCMDYQTAEKLYEEIFKQDPYRLEDLDIYSNVLYVMQNHSKLSFLAQWVMQTEKLRPETCCIVANYYSCRQEHEKSIMYFRRSLQLNKRSTNVWTLMGHEYVELRNSNAAIECYRRAIDLNQRDFKAWFGLGQAYEVMEMPQYSLYYFKQACTIRPLDRRMWQALGECFLSLNQYDDALISFQKALPLCSNMNQDAMILYKIALCYDEMLKKDECRDIMLKCIQIEDNSEDSIVTDETIKARLWLAKHYRIMKQYQEAYNHAVKIVNGTSEEITEARNIAKECRLELQKIYG